MTSSWLVRLEDRQRLPGVLLRSTLAVIMASLLAGVLAVAYTAWVTSQRAHQASEIRLAELLDTGVPVLETNNLADCKAC